MDGELGVSDYTYIFNSWVLMKWKEPSYHFHDKQTHLIPIRLFFTMEGSGKHRNELRGNGAKPAVSSWNQQQAFYHPCAMCNGFSQVFFYLCLLQPQRTICSVTRRDTFKEFSWIKSTHVVSCDLILLLQGPWFGTWYLEFLLEWEAERPFYFNASHFGTHQKPPVSLLNVFPDFFSFLNNLAHCPAYCQESLKTANCLYSFHKQTQTGRFGEVQGGKRRAFHFAGTKFGTVEKEE